MQVTVKGGWKGVKWSKTAYVLCELIILLIFGEKDYVENLLKEKFGKNCN